MDKISPEHEKRKEWADKNIPIITSQVQNELDGFSNHFLLAAPISMADKNRRANAISQAFLKATEL